MLIVMEGLIRSVINIPEGRRASGTISGTPAAAALVEAVTGENVQAQLTEESSHLTVSELKAEGSHQKLLS